MKDGERKTILSIKRLRCLSYTGHFKTKCKTDSGSLEHSGQAGAIVLLIRHVDKTFMPILNRVKIFLIQGFLILYMYDSWRSSSMKYFNVSNLLEESNLLLLSCLNWSSKRVLKKMWKEELAMKGLSQTSPNPWVFNKAWMHCTQLCFSWVAVLCASFTSLFCVPVVSRNQYLQMSYMMTLIIKSQEKFRFSYQYYNPVPSGSCRFDITELYEIINGNGLHFLCVGCKRWKVLHAFPMGNVHIEMCCDPKG